MFEVYSKIVLCVVSDISLGLWLLRLRVCHRDTLVQFQLRCECPCLRIRCFSVNGVFRLREAKDPFSITAWGRVTRTLLTACLKKDTKPAKWACTSSSSCTRRLALSCADQGVAKLRRYPQQRSKSSMNR